MRSLTELCDFRLSVEWYVTPKSPLQYKQWRRFRRTQLTYGYANPCSRLSRGCSNLREQPLCCSCTGNHTANYRVCVKWKETKMALVKQAPELGRNGAPSENAAGRPYAKKMKLGDGWNCTVRMEHVNKTTTTPLLFQIHSYQSRRHLSSL